VSPLEAQLALTSGITYEFDDRILQESYKSNVGSHVHYLCPPPCTAQALMMIRTQSKSCGFHSWAFHMVLMMKLSSIIRTHWFRGKAGM
jgi:hypothetical protein